MGHKAEATELDLMFISIYMKIKERGLPLEVLCDAVSRKANVPQKCYELDRMIAIRREDGSRELGVRADGMVMIGMFPSMDSRGHVRLAVPERLAYYKNNLEYYQARLKL
ncbi:MAG: hypothetical protein DI551_06515 [Micavibrio aeruginosavorus]|uniref:Uncharacterized protein n=1 Tax=Micavibrio aeruginosavorus TaxID=349221 RepID=A0A2W5PMB8_9BACT|nr:MAG: hypothetical protein DI551_06515 [Micavibrio aeruginosavorus]